MKDKRLIFLLGISILLIILIGVFRPREVDWTPTFAANDKIPYGSYIAYNSLHKLFADKIVTLSKEQPYDWENEGKRKKSFCFIEDQFAPSPTNAEALLYLARTGNDIFVSSLHISGTFADSLNLKQRANLNAELVMRVFDKDTVAGLNVNFTSARLHSDSGYWYRSSPLSYYYNVDDTDFINQGFITNSPAKSATVLGADAFENANFIVIHYGAGRILLHNNPFAFTNYYMLKPANAEYTAKCFSYLQGDEIVWSEYFKQGKQSADLSTLSFVLSREPLRWAYYIFLGSIVVFVIFNVKRRQRVIPVADSYRNTSLEFAQLVGALYYNQSDHRDIMVKKVNYLLEFIRNRYNMDTREINQEFIQKLAAKTAIEEERIEYLFTLVEGTMKKRWLSKHELVELSSAIQYFKNQCQ